MPFPLPVTPVIVVMLIPVPVFSAALLIPVLLPILDSVPLPVPLLALTFVTLHVPSALPFSFAAGLQHLLDGEQHLCVEVARGHWQHFQGQAVPAQYRAACVLVCLHICNAQEAL